MKRFRTCALVVVENDHAIGTICDRDLVWRAIAEGLEPSSTPVTAVMSRDFHIVPMDYEAGVVIEKMSDGTGRRIVVVDEDAHPVDVLAPKDLFGVLADGFAELASDEPFRRLGAVKNRVEKAA